MLRGLTVEIDTFHASDARVYQLPTILQLSERLDFSDYPSAQTPLYHLLTAAWGKLVGFELWKLRLLNVGFSYAMALALLRLLRRATPLPAWPAFALTLLFVLSPYVFGASFTLLTDNLAILFALVALERIHAWSRSGSLAAFGLACAAIAAALLTRQAFIWLVPVAAFFLVSAPPRRRARRPAPGCSRSRSRRSARSCSNGTAWCPRAPTPPPVASARIARVSRARRSACARWRSRSRWPAATERSFSARAWRRLRTLRSSALARIWVSLTGLRDTRRLVGRRGPRACSCS